MPVQALQVQQFISLMEKADFWSLEMEPMSKEASQRMDAALWVMEGRVNGRYHFVNRRVEKRQTGLGRASVFLMKLSQAHKGRKQPSR